MPELNTLEPRGIVEITLGKEVVQPSTIAHYQWPEGDPAAVEQANRLVEAADLDLIRRAATPAPRTCLPCGGTRTG